MLVIGWAIGLAACGNEDLDIVGTDARFLRPNQFLTLNTDTLTLLNFQADSVSTGSLLGSPSAILGIQRLPDGKELRATAHLKFSYPLAALDSSFNNRPGAIVRITDVSLILQQVRAQADSVPSLAPLDVEIFRSPTLWSSSTLQSNTPFMERERLASVRLLKGDSLSVEVPLPRWYGDSLLAAARRGQQFLQDSTTLTLSLVPRQGEAVITINGLLSFLRLSFDLRTQTSIERRSVLMPVFDAGYTGSKNFEVFDSDAIFLAPTIGARSILKFQLPMLRPGVLVSRAELLLVRDTLYTPIQIGDYQVGVSKATANRQSSSEAPEQRMVILQRNQYRLLVTGIVQQWANQPSTNYGFLLRSISQSLPPSEAGSLSPLRFFGPAAPDSLRPRLVVSYIVSNF
ncbi:MAG: hypothetical protein RMI34_11010 [Chloroherpetonaceae bacterium]|nr:hypothetical protein [Chloroherpetonaceae bacterium]